MCRGRRSGFESWVTESDARVQVHEPAVLVDLIDMQEVEAGPAGVLTIDIGVADVQVGVGLPARPYGAELRLRNREVGFDLVLRPHALLCRDGPIRAAADQPALRFRLPYQLHGDRAGRIARFERAVDVEADQAKHERPPAMPAHHSCSTYASSTATNPTRKTPSKTPAPPMESTPAPMVDSRGRCRMSAPRSVPSEPPTYATATACGPVPTRNQAARAAATGGSSTGMVIPTPGTGRAIRKQITVTNSVTAIVSGTGVCGMSQALSPAGKMAPPTLIASTCSATAGAR